MLTVFTGCGTTGTSTEKGATKKETTLVRIEITRSEEVSTFSTDNMIKAYVPYVPQDEMLIASADVSSPSNNENTNIMHVGEDVQAKAMGYYSDGSSKDISSSVVWSSETRHASVDDLGLIFGESEGQASIFASVGGIVGNALGAVISPPSPPPVDLVGVKKTGQIESYSENDDGAYQAGIEPSYVRDDAHEIVTDFVSELMWQDDINVTLNETDQVTAIRRCKDLTLGDFTDWRLPTIVELLGIVDKGRFPLAISSQFTYVQPTFYWSISDQVLRPEKNQAWTVYFEAGTDHYRAKRLNIGLVRCVRNKL